MSKVKITEGFLLPLTAGTAAGVIANQFPQNLKHSKNREKAAKKLKKVEPNFSKSADFNERAAQQAFDLVMKMDTETARVFTEMVVGDVVEETIEKNLRMLQGHLNKVVEKRLDVLKTAVIRASINDAEGALPFAKALSEISKAKTPYDYGYRFQETDFNRDPSSGRFRMKVKHKQTAPLSDRHAQAVVGTPNPKGLKGRQLAEFQDEYRQLAAYLDAVNATVGQPGDAQTILHLQDKKTGERYVENYNGKKSVRSLLADPNTRLLGAESRPTALTIGGASFGLSGALGHPMTTTRVGQINTAAEGFGSFADTWTNQDLVGSHNRNDRTYQRLEAGSQYLGTIAPAGSKLQMATKFGQFVGSHGPQAEAVIGPTARKTAYRYRGTEKTPDQAMVREYEAAVNRAKMSSAQAPLRRSLVERPMGSGHTPVTQRAREIQAEHRNPTWDEREGGRQAIVRYFRGSSQMGVPGRLPAKRLSRLQLESGNTPPSEGVIINKDGQIVSQAIGYGDDHYLPFDLKNLKSLKGGEYIRTRSYGGPTSEDVYTALVTGARQLTVVSHSGVFTMEFEPDFRGGRRYNDKARRMTRRYEQILDAVQSEQVDKEGIRPEVKFQIARRVRDDNPYLSPAEQRTLITEAEKEYKDNPELTADDEAVINQLAIAASASDPSRDAKTYIAQITDKFMADKDTRFRLDGPGYAEAMEALREQFPYYIKVRSVPETEKETTSRGRDFGYVEPGRNRPTAARAGLFGTVRGKSGKFSAANADYQGFHAVRRGGTAEVGTGPGSGAPEDPAENTDPKSVVRTRIQQYGLASASLGLINAVNQYGALGPKSRADRPWLDYEPDQLAEFVKDPSNAGQIQSIADSLAQVDQNQLRPEVRQAIRNYQKANGALDRPEFEPGMMFSWTAKPPKLSGAKQYAPDAPFEMKQREYEKLNQTPGLLSNKPLGEMSDEEMKDEMVAMSAVYEAVKDVPGFFDTNTKEAIADRQQVARDINTNLLGGRYNEGAVYHLIQDPQKLERRMENVQRMRALRANLTPEEQSRLRGPKEVNVSVEFSNPITPLNAAQRNTLREQMVKGKIDELHKVAREEKWVRDSVKARDLAADGESLLANLDDVDDSEVVNYIEEAQREIDAAQRRRATS